MEFPNGKLPVGAATGCEELGAAEAPEGAEAPCEAALGVPKLPKPPLNAGNRGAFEPVPPMEFPPNVNLTGANCVLSSLLPSSFTLESTCDPCCIPPAICDAPPDLILVPFILLTTPVPAWTPPEGDPAAADGAAKLGMLPKPPKLPKGLAFWLLLELGDAFEDGDATGGPVENALLLLLKPPKLPKLGNEPNEF